MSEAPLLLRALHREVTPRPPVWLMRQAGRYLPEYREVRAKAGGFLEMVQNPELATEVTLQPVRRFGVDGAVIFSDILLPLQAMGMPLVYEEKRGPVLPARLNDERRIDKLAIVEPERSLRYVGEALQRTRAELPDDVALIGFCGAPFTLACYAVEGGHSRTQIQTRQLMYREPQLFGRLMDKLAKVVARHLRYQVEQGAQAVVLFDTWAGTLSREDYRAFARPWTAQALESVEGMAPRMSFVLGGDHLLADIVRLGVEAVAVDWRTSLSGCFEAFGDQVAVQGNLDPSLMVAPPEEVERRAREMLDGVGARPGYVMSLGHGIPKEARPESVAAFVEVVKSAETAHA